MIDDLDPVQARVLGALIEKELATPDQYPLSLNALLLACNQKTNREPVMSLREDEVAATVESLIARHLVREKNPAGARVAKYAHRLSGGLSHGYALDAPQLGVLCMLVLRGPQTPGELRARTARLADLREPGAVERTLERLASAERGPFVARLERQPGRKEARYAHLLCGEPAALAAAAAGATAMAAGAPGGNAFAGAGDDSDPTGRLATLEERVAELEAALDSLRARLGDAVDDD